MSLWRPGLWISLFACTLISISSIGCGVGSDVSPNPSASLAATSHPLVAQYNVTVPKKNATAWVEFGPDANYGRQTSPSAATTSYGEQVPILVAGMVPNSTYHMRAHIDMADGQSWVDQDRTFKTGQIPSTLVQPTFTITQPDPNTPPSPGVELLDLIGPNNVDMLEALVTDTRGNIIWYYDVGQGSVPEPIKLLPNGHMLLVIQTASATQVTAVLREVDLAGNTIREVSTDTLSKGLQALGHPVTLMQLHHDFALLPNGHIVLLGNIAKAFTDLPGYPGVTNVTGDVLIDIDQNWQPVWFWSTFDHLDVNRHLQGLPDWTHGNAIVYSQTDGNLLFSMRHQSWVIKIDYNNGSGTGSVLWKLGEDGDFTIQGGDSASWFYGQHYPWIVSTNGSQSTISIMDNGNLRIDQNGDPCKDFVNCYSRSAIFQIDESKKSASVQWADQPQGIYSFWGGAAEVLPSGNVEADFCAAFGFNKASQVMEVTQDAVPQLVWQDVINGANAYRAYRIPSLYPEVEWKQ